MVADADCEPVAVTVPSALTLVPDITDAVDVPLLVLVLVLELLTLALGDGLPAHTQNTHHRAGKQVAPTHQPHTQPTPQ
jgi:hypothetical protein